MTAAVAGAPALCCDSQVCHSHLAPPQGAPHAAYKLLLAGGDHARLADCCLAAAAVAREQGQPGAERRLLWLQRAVRHQCGQRRYAAALDLLLREPPLVQVRGC